MTLSRAGSSSGSASAMARILNEVRNAGSSMAARSRSSPVSGSMPMSISRTYRARVSAPSGKKPCTCSSAGSMMLRSNSHASFQSTSSGYSPCVWCSSILLAMSASSSLARMSSWDSSPHSSIHWRSSPSSMVLCSMSGAFLSVVRMIHRPWSRRSGVSAGHDVYKGR